MFYPILFGAIAGVGLLFLRLGFKGHRIFGAHAIGDVEIARTIAAALGAGVSFYLLTRWILSSAAVAIAVLLLTRSLTHRKDKRGQEEVAEAMALWTEQLRDTLAAAHGLQQTLVATAAHSPDRIRPAVINLVSKLPYAPVGQSLRDFANEVDHSSADFVVAALLSATEHEARDVGSLLGHLAKCAREEARMHQRIWVGRARTRTAVRIITGTVVGFIAILFTMNRNYLAPYGSGEGQLVLSVIVLTFGLALWMLQAGSKVQVPERFVGVRK